MTDQRPLLPVTQAPGANDDCRARPDWSADQVEQLVFELSWELEEASLSANDYVTVNRAKLKTIAERVLGRLTAEQDGWKSIESAPKDGRAFDLWGSEEGWRTNRPAAPGHRRLASCRYDRQGPCPGIGWYGWIMPDGRRVEIATHWRPLPTPPSNILDSTKEAC